MTKIGIETQRIFDKWEKLTVDEKKAVAKKRSEFAKRNQGKIWFAPGFSFDSDSKVNLYSTTP